MTKQAKYSAALALVAALGLGGAGVAQAHGSDDVFWSIAMSQPGIHIGVSNAPAAPVVVHERRHVHVHPQPVYVPPRVVYLPPPVYRHPGHHGHAHGHWSGRDDRHHGHWGGHRGGREEFAHNGGRGHGGGNGPRPGTEGHMGNRR